MNCKICNQKNQSIFDAEVLNKYRIKYYHCSNCGFLQTQEPYWLEEAYSDSINISDTGYLQRNINLSKKLTIFLAIYFGKNAKYLDYAGGYGIFVRLMRDIGFDFYWDDRYTLNLFAKGFKYTENQIIDAITTFESFEHFVNPIQEIEYLLKISENIIFSTELLPNKIPEAQDWWYYGLEHGQHISFYSEQTLHFIANKYGLNYYNFGVFHLISKNRIPSYLKIILKFSKFGFHLLLQKQLKSKTWDDYLKMSKSK
ncbi:MAG: hypothetical protein A2513_03295 [Sulfurimonas sp. RIFOXYD12_FULL_33_39]|uniref:class I SAM-dependent methyltransferase n=1 Tax=unclassified Sulfurimonas TaxID=2623549 RepID=UPI0008BF89A1|nr:MULTISPECIES: class I SAM-dependent methyltransferase [unclassified Sulfurimonas]OHE06485.1 MAG: hypothetical protein A3G74_02410 [Sulfurimonas sp. RIFCSPLOWO2_12_FULL_34_6]OHE09016.1 MAG: hypothetical protein A2513_03295 [Sulfurimonas sp. RIFOXYD12_FULL_33_39]OHE14326.1 MAG: hypothetical protein A2530_06595 [Sulfurimonas sp. RIFOXYD2_FULL_34_21]